MAPCTNQPTARAAARLLVCGLLTVSLALAAAASTARQPTHVSLSPVEAPNHLELNKAYGHFAVQLRADSGPGRPDGSFVARGSGHTLALGAGAAELSLQASATLFRVDRAAEPPELSS